MFFSWHCGRCHRKFPSVCLSVYHANVLQDSNFCEFCLSEPQIGNLVLWEHPHILRGGFFQWKTFSIFETVPDTVRLALLLLTGELCMRFLSVLKSTMTLIDFEQHSVTQNMHLFGLSPP